MTDENNNTSSETWKTSRNYSIALILLSVLVIFMQIDYNMIFILIFITAAGILYFTKNITKKDLFIVIFFVFILLQFNFFYYGSSIQIANPLSPPS